MDSFDYWFTKGTLLNGTDEVFSIPRDSFPGSIGKTALDSFGNNNWFTPFISNGSSGMPIFEVSHKESLYPAAMTTYTSEFNFNDPNQWSFLPG
jgi:hypothetical protein